MHVMFCLQTVPLSLSLYRYPQKRHTVPLTHFHHFSFWLENVHSDFSDNDMIRLLKIKKYAFYESNYNVLIVLLMLQMKMLLNSYCFSVIIFLIFASALILK